MDILSGLTHGDWLINEDRGAGGVDEWFVFVAKAGPFEARGQGRKRSEAKQNTAQILVDKLLAPGGLHMFQDYKASNGVLYVASGEGTQVHLDRVVIIDSDLWMDG
jgi:hypothetical protein